MQMLSKAAAAEESFENIVAKRCQCSHNENFLLLSQCFLSFFCNNYTFSFKTFPQYLPWSSESVLMLFKQSWVFARRELKPLLPFLTRNSAERQQWMKDTEFVLGSNTECFLHTARWQYMEHVFIVLYSQKHCGKRRYCSLCFPKLSVAEVSLRVLYAGKG